MLVANRLVARGELLVTTRCRGTYHVTPDRQRPACAKRHDRIAERFHRDSTYERVQHERSRYRKAHGYPARLGTRVVQPHAPAPHKRHVRARVLYFIIQQHAQRRHHRNRTTQFSARGIRVAMDHGPCINVHGNSGDDQGSFCMRVHHAILANPDISCSLVQRARQREHVTMLWQRQPPGNTGRTRDELERLLPRVVRIHVHRPSAHRLPLAPIREPGRALEHHDRPPLVVYRDRDRQRIIHRHQLARGGGFNEHTGRRNKRRCRARLCRFERYRQVANGAIAPGIQCGGLAWQRLTSRRQQSHDPRKRRHHRRRRREILDRTHRCDRPGQRIERRSRTRRHCGQRASAETRPVRCDVLKR